MIGPGSNSFFPLSGGPGDSDSNTQWLLHDETQITEQSVGKVLKWVYHRVVDSDRVLRSH